MIPQLNIEMKENWGIEWISADTEDEMVVNFYYPQIFEAFTFLRLKLTISRMDAIHETRNSIAAEKYPDIFSQRYSVLTIDVERTFWETHHIT